MKRKPRPRLLTMQLPGWEFTFVLHKHGYPISETMLPLTVHQGRKPFGSIYSKVPTSSVHTANRAQAPSMQAGAEGGAGVGEAWALPLWPWGTRRLRRDGLRRKGALHRGRLEVRLEGDRGPSEAAGLWTLVWKWMGLPHGKGTAVESEREKSNTGWQTGPGGSYETWLGWYPWWLWGRRRGQMCCIRPQWRGEAGKMRERRESGKMRAGTRRTGSPGSTSALVKAKVERRKEGAGVSTSGDQKWRSGLGDTNSES